MKISDYQKTEKKISVIAVLFIFGAFLYLIWLSLGKNLFTKTTLQIESIHDTATVRIDSQDNGQTPLKISDLSGGEHVIELYKEGPFYTSWSQKFSLNTRSELTIKREIGPTSYFSSGEVVYFEADGSGLSLTSNPDKVQVMINNNQVGQTPLFLPDYPVGSYEVLFLKEGYEGKKVTVTVKSGLTTHVSADLLQIPGALNPDILLESDITDFPNPEVISREQWKADEGLKQTEEDTYSPVNKMKLYDLSTDDEMLYSNAYDWLQGLYYYEVVYLEKPDLTYHFLLDREGRIYEGKAGGLEISIPGDEAQVARIGYLGKKGEGLTEKARFVYTTLEQNTGQTTTYKAGIKEGVPSSLIELEAGKKEDLGVIFRNNGEAIWYDQAPKQVYLKTDTAEFTFYTAENWVDQSKVKVLPVSFVAKDQEVRFEFTVTAPNEDGEHEEHFALYVEKNGLVQKIEGSEFSVKIKVTGGVQKMVLIKETGTGYLNVRDKPGLGGGVIDRVTPGEKYLYLEEQSGWVKIKLHTGIEGWVSSQYTEKVN